MSKSTSKTTNYLRAAASVALIAIPASLVIPKAYDAIHEPHQQSIIYGPVENGDYYANTYTTHAEGEAPTTTAIIAYNGTRFSREHMRRIDDNNYLQRVQATKFTTTPTQGHVYATIARGTSAFSGTYDCAVHKYNTLPPCAQTVKTAVDDQLQRVLEQATLKKQ